MIPHFILESFYIGPIQIHTWGLMVSLGVLFAVFLAVQQAKRRGLRPGVFADLAFWSVLGALIGGRIIHVAGAWEYYGSHLGEIWRLWEGGLGVTGGFIGAIIAGAIVLRVRGLSFWEYGDVGFFVLPAGLMIGRIGCAMLFDHPGKGTTFFLGQEFTDGIIRHNHGLYLALFGALLMVIFTALRSINPNRFRGFYIGLFMILYGIGRFGLDFYRAWDAPYADPRFFGLTLAQYVMIGFFIVGIGIMIRRRQSGRQPTSPLHFANNIKH